MTARYFTIQQQSMTASVCDVKIKVTTKSGGDAVRNVTFGADAIESGGNKLYRHCAEEQVARRQRFVAVPRLPGRG
jgi:hypothetical protein